MRPSSVLSAIPSRVSAVLACLLLVMAAMPAAVSAAPQASPKAQSWIVLLKPSADMRAAKQLARSEGGSIGLTYRHAVKGFQFDGSAKAAAALARNPQVRTVSLDHALTLTETLPYGIKRIDAHVPGSPDGAYQNGFRGAGARIAIIDTGIDLDHPDLAASVDVTGGKNCQALGTPPNDGHGHGTHVAGTAAAPLNGVGVVGVAPEAQLVPVKVFDDAGNSAESLVLCGLDYVTGLNNDGDAANDIDVASMSFGESRSWGDCVNDALHAFICAAAATGIVLVGGAGNSAVNAGSFVPAAFPEVISVSAIADFDGNPGGLAGCGFVPDIFWFECDDTFAMFSNYGPVDVTAPGVSINSTWAGGGYSTISGTSMATPHVSGVAALMKAVNPSLTGADVLALLVQTGECPNGTYADADGTPGCVGQGTRTDDPDGVPEPLVNALRAAQAAGGEPPPPPPPPTPPAAPTLSATPGNNRVNLSWNAPANGGSQITNYVVYRGDSPGTATELTTIGSTTTFSDQTAVNGQTYYYQVAARNIAGTGPRSNEVSATPQPTPPAAPVLSASAGNGVVNLTWTVPNNGGSALTGYTVYRGTAAGSVNDVVGNPSDPNFADTAVTVGTTYFYQVTASNGVGEGPRSNQVSAAPRNWDQAPQGDWIGSFGADGYALLGWENGGDLVALPQAVLTLESGSRYRWAASTNNVRALENVAQTERRATQWFNNTSLRFRLTFTAAYSGTLHLYALDWDSSSRRQNVVVTDPSGVRNVNLNASFNGGAWLHFPINVQAGDEVSVRADKTAGGNATLSGLFLGGAGTPPAAPPQQWEQAPQGDWVGSYGHDGYALLGWNSGGDLVSLPTATLVLDQGSRYRWAAPTTNVRALENAAQSERRATQWFHNTSLRFHLTFSSPYSGTLHLYALDWDATNRRENVLVTDANGTQVVGIQSSFNGGAWMHFPVNVAAGGTVSVRVDKTAGGNGTLSGLFLGGP
jgi:subtilisin family serine protease